MAYLVGVEFPANSVGELPLQFLTADIKDKAEASLVNTQGILEQYRVKEEKKKATELRYRPYRPLSEHGLDPDRRVADVRKLIEAGHYEEAIEESAALMKVGLEGLRYLQTYDWLFLRALVTIGYLGWIAYALTTVLDLHVLHGQKQPSRPLAGSIFFSSILILLYASFIASKSPVTYYIYAFFPTFFWEEVYARRGEPDRGTKGPFREREVGQRRCFIAPQLRALCRRYRVPGESKRLYPSRSISCRTAFFNLRQAMGYIHREILTGLYLLGAFWPAAYGFRLLQKHTALVVAWFLACLAMSTFTLLPPAMKTEDVTLM